MSMGHSAVFAVVIEEEDLEKLQLEELPLFYQAIEEAKTTIEDVADIVRFDEYDMSAIDFEEELTQDELLERVRPVTDAYERLRDTFKARTGLTLFLNRHNSEDDGDIYDDVSGCFWELSFGDVYALTPEAKKLKETMPFDIQQFVVYG